MSLGNVVFAERGITVKLNGEALSFDVPPQVINERTMVPVRAIFEALGAVVNWEGNSVVTSKKDDTSVSIIIGVPAITVNGVAKELDTAPCVIDNRTLVPVRAISEAYDMNVDWDAGTKTVLITDKNKTEEDAPYNILKNIIISDGIIDDGDYCILNRTSIVPFLLTYYPDKNEISLFSNYNDKNMNESVSITLYPDDVPSVFFMQNFLMALIIAFLQITRKKQTISRKHKFLSKKFWRTGI
ncbi:MAG: copper amine oxidase N-terminal domain-containing protein [Clostridia bacterium]|nr:copper amine oxidase N-terminal domain-containing protein [Clostridia bacterium]